MVRFVLVRLGQGVCKPANARAPPAVRVRRWFYSQSRSFYGIRCTHQPSPWIGDYGNIRFMASALPLSVLPAMDHSRAPAATPATAGGFPPHAGAALPPRRRPISRTQTTMA